MGLIAELFHFKRGLPALAAVASETELQFGRALIVDGTLVLSESDRAEIGRRKSIGFHIALAKDARASIRVATPLRADRKRWVDLFVALDGTQIFVQSQKHDTHA